MSEPGVVFVAFDTPPFDCGARAKAGDAVMARVREYDALRQ